MLLNFSAVLESLTAKMSVFPSFCDLNIFNQIFLIQKFSRMFLSNSSRYWSLQDVYLQQTEKTPFGLMSIIKHFEKGHS